MLLKPLNPSSAGGLLSFGVYGNALFCFCSCLSDHYSFSVLCIWQQPIAEAVLQLISLSNTAELPVRVACIWLFLPPTHPSVLSEENALPHPSPTPAPT